VAPFAISQLSLANPQAQVQVSAAVLLPRALSTLLPLFASNRALTPSESPAMFQALPRVLLASLLLASPLPGWAESPTGVRAGELEANAIDDAPSRRDLAHPEWFKHSFLDLREDLAEAKAQGRRLAIYFGQRHCAYCQALMEVNFGQEDIVEYTRRHFEIVPIDIWSDLEVVDLEGNRLSEKAFAERERSTFTPTLVFYDEDGREVMRLRGFYPPYQFRAALEYVADRHYRTGGFREYLARADVNMTFEPGDLIEEDVFVPPPHILDRTRIPSDRPLVVVFEQGNCHACDVLHTEQLRDPRIKERIAEFEVVQLDLWGEAPVLTPDGRRMSAREWAQDLGLFYAPTLLFFDERGQEIIRIDSVVRFHRLAAVMDFVLSRDYLAQPYFMRWREERMGRRLAPGEG
jgi:thioredoxin-related protein